MKIVKNKHSFFDIVFNKQEVDKNKRYRFFQYVIKNNVDNGVLLFNSLSKELILIDAQEYNLINNNIINSDIFVNLVENYFLVPEEYEDYYVAMNYLSLYKNFIRPSNKYISYTIMTTMECNARCFYCFENDGRTVDRMTKETSDSLVNFILDNSDINETIQLIWFGGEPLLNTDVIDNICKKLKNNGVDFDSIVVTNGYLLTPEVSKKAFVNWNLKSVQITLDGREEVYNKVKNYIYNDGISPFNKVIGNIKGLIENNIFVQIRINMDLYNADELLLLFEYLNKEFPDCKDKYGISLHMINEKDVDGISRHTYDERRKLLSEFSKLATYILDHDIPTVRKINLDYKIVHCNADDDRSIVVTPSGKLTKCQNYSDTQIVGDIFNNKLDINLINDWKEIYSDIEICNTCPIFPDCTPIKKCPSEVKCDCFQQEEKLVNMNLAILNKYERFLIKENINDNTNEKCKNC